MRSPTWPMMARATRRNHESRLVDFYVAKSGNLQIHVTDAFWLCGFLVVTRIDSAYT